MYVSAFGVTINFMSRSPHSTLFATSCRASKHTHPACSPLWGLDTGCGWHPFLQHPAAWMQAVIVTALPSEDRSTFFGTSCAVVDTNLILRTGCPNNARLGAPEAGWGHLKTFQHIFNFAAIYSFKEFFSTPSAFINCVIPVFKAFLVIPEKCFKISSVRDT